MTPTCHLCGYDEPVEIDPITNTCDHCRGVCGCQSEAECLQLA